MPPAPATLNLSPLAQLDPPDWLASLWYVALVILGFSVVIFFHELGHFIAAKWAGVRVERFAIGFGRELFGFTWGETRYSFNVLPLGGFVKMLGQEDFAVDKSGELKVRDDPASFTSKPVGKRMVIVSAGVVMNLLFATAAFAAVMMIGQYTLPAIVGVVDPASAAGRAGLRTGDRIVAVNGQEIKDFTDLKMVVVLSDQNEELEITAYRDGKLVEPPPRVLPEYKPDAKMRQIGLGLAMTRRVAFTMSRLLGYSPADELRPNDLLYKIGAGPDAREITSAGDVWQALIEARGLPIDLTVKRPTGRVDFEELTSAEADIPSTEAVVKAWAVWRLQPSEDDDLGASSLLGLVPRLWVIDVDPNGAAALAGIKRGDAIVRVGTLDNPSLAELAAEVETNPDRDLRIAVRRSSEANGNLSAPIVAMLALHRERLIAAARTDPDNAREQLKSLAAETGLSHPERAFLDATAARLATPAAWRAWLERVDVHELIARPKVPFALFGPRPKSSLGISQIYPMEDEQLVVADVLQTLRGRPSPAASAGIPRGATIISVDGRPVSRWTELTEAFRTRAGRIVPVEFRVGDVVTSVSFPIPECLSTIVDLPPGAQLTEIAGEATARIETARGVTRTAALPDWQVVEAILRRNVGRTVSVKFRTRNGGAVEKPMTVTPDNTDPWVLRVAYGPSFGCYPLREFVREPNPFKAVVLGFRRAYNVTLQTYLTIKHIVFTREVGVENVSGPVGIVRKGSQIAEGGFTSLLWFLGLISANLAVINFLPLPIVDGGLFVFLLLEKIRGEPVSIRTQVVTQLIGIALIVTMFLFVTFQDIANWNN